VFHRVVMGVWFGMSCYLQGEDGTSNWDNVKVIEEIG